MSDLIPNQITAGLSFDLLLTLTCYPAPEWSATLILRGTADTITITSTAEDTQHRLKQTATETGEWAAGTYSYALRVTDGTDVFESESGTLTIKPDIGVITGDYDPRSHVRKTLEAIEATIAGRATKDQERYRINNRELWRTAISELLKLRSVYQEELRREDAAASGRSALLGRNVKVRF